jgi:hypothetical protein
VDPLQGSARFRLRLHEQDDGSAADREDEPLDLDRRSLSALMRASMSQAILAAQGVPTLQDLLAVYARKNLRGELAGQSPTGLFRSAASRLEVDLAAVLGPSPAECRVAQFVEAYRDGEGGVPGLAIRPAPQFGVDLPASAGETRRRVDIRIEGQSELWARSAAAGDASLIFSCRGRIEKEGYSREELRAFLDYVVLAASGTKPMRPGHRGALFFASDGLGKLRVLRFRPLGRQPALDYLARLCGDFLTGARDDSGAWTGVHPYLLPHEAVVASRRNGTSIVAEIDDLRAGHESRGTSFSSLQGPVPGVLARYAPLTEPQAQRAARERFGLFFALAEEKTA